LEGSGQLSSRASDVVEKVATSVLMVDDHAANLLALEAILEPLGQRLVRASSGAEALRWLLKEDFALILLDVQMPELDGFETARLIRQRQRTRYTPIIFLTAHGRDEAHLVHGYEVGAADYVVKPFHPDVLRWKVDAFVALYVQQQRLQHAEAALWERERRMLERQSERRFQRLVDSMPLFVWAILPDGTISYVNRGWLEYTGLTPEQARQREENHRFLHPEDVPRLDAAWEQARRTEEPWEVEYRLKGRDGTYRWFLGRSLAERDEDGQLSGWISTATNVDDARQAVETLRTANAEKDMFLTMAAHELRTPLQAARSYAHLARVKAGEDLPPGVNRALQGIHRSVGRMASLVENLLDVGQLQRGELRMAAPVELDAGRLLREVAEQFQPLPEGARLKVEAPEGLVVRGDRERLDQVFTNLISNALRYSPGGGPVYVTAREEPGQVHFEVKDHGLGIPVEKLERIFERFGRAHGISYGGLGLGLTIARGIVERHGGRIWAESAGKDGEGSSFHVVLPRP